MKFTKIGIVRSRRPKIGVVQRGWRSTWLREMTRDQHREGDRRRLMLPWIDLQHLPSKIDMPPPHDDDLGILPKLHRIYLRTLLCSRMKISMRLFYSNFRENIEISVDIRKIMEIDDIDVTTYF